MATGTDKDTLKVSIEDINQVTEELKPDELKLLYDNLGIDPVDVDHVEVTMASAGTHDTILKARTVLRELWLQKKGISAKREELFGERDKILKRRTEKPEVDAKEFNLQECQDQLKQLYLGQDMKVQLTPWDPEHAVEMEAIFVNLEMAKDEVSPSQTEQIPLQKNEDLLTLKTSTGRRINRVLIQGEPGSGKSTLLNNIAYKWALQLLSKDSPQRSDPSLSQFDLVFVISVHEIVDNTDSLVDIIFDQILEEGETVTKTSLKSYLKSNSERCLFLVDGLDEDSVGILKSTTHEVSQLLNDKKFKQSCVIASIRPYKLQTMGHNQGKFVKVNLTGFSDKNIEVYLKKYFAGNKEVNHAALLQRLKEEPNVRSLAGTPLLLLFFCLLWYDPYQSKKTLPNTRTKLFQETIVSLWKRYHYEQQGVSQDDLDTDELQSKLISFLETLGKVSLEQQSKQMKDKVLFADNDFEETALSLAMRVGLLSKEKIRSRKHKTFVKFVHSSFQDFCSAVYLANLHPTYHEQCIEYMAKLLYPIWIPKFNRFADILIFCAGFKPETAKLITGQVVAAIDLLETEAKGEKLQPNSEDANLQVLLEQTSASRVAESNGEIPEQKISNEKVFTYTCSINMIFVIVFEAQLTHEECNELVNILSSTGCPLGLKQNLDQIEKHIQYQLDLLKPDSNNGLLFSLLSFIHFPDTIMLPRFYSLFISMLRYTKKLCRFHLKFHLTRNASKEMSHLTEMFDALSTLTQLNELILDTDINDLFIISKVDITDALHRICHLKLQVLELNEITVTIPSMAKFLSSNKSLNTLSFVLCPHSIKPNALDMMKVIASKHSLTQLKLGNIGMHTNVKYLQPIIPNLAILELHWCSFEEWDLHKLASYLEKANTLKGLSIVGNYFGGALGNLANRLKYMVNLKMLNLSYNGLTDGDAITLADGVKTMSSLHILDLQGNLSIGFDGRQAIENLHVCPQLKELHIEFDPKPTKEQDRQEYANSELQTEHEGLINKFSSEMTSAFHLLEQFIGNKQLHQQILQESKKPNLPNCCSCMSQIYYGVKCKKNFTKTSSTLKNGQHERAEVAGAMAASCKQTNVKKMEKNDEKHSQHLESSINNTYERKIDFEQLMSKYYASGKDKPIATADDLKLPVQKSVNGCYNLNCSNLETEVPGGLKKCTQCNIARYCSKDCQKTHWKIHKITCGIHPGRKQSLSPSKKAKKL